MVALLIAGSGMAARYVEPTNHVVLFLAAFSRYLSVFGLISVGLLALARRTLFAVVVLILLAAPVAVQFPRYVGIAAARSGSVDLRVLSANLRDGDADPEHLVRVSRDSADVLAFQELTPAEVDRISRAGMDAAFPYRFLDARDDADGVGLWSRFPLGPATRIGGYRFALVSAQLQVPGTSPDPIVFSAHLMAPWPQPIDVWRREIASFPATLRKATESTTNGCVIVAGDFNSTIDMRPFRALRRHGYTDAAEQTGAIPSNSFPADTWLPPVIGIDHILTRGCSARSLGTIPVTGSDHRGIVAIVSIPGEGTVGNRH